MLNNSTLIEKYRNSLSTWDSSSFLRWLYSGVVFRLLQKNDENLPADYTVISDENLAFLVDKRIDFTHYDIEDLLSDRNKISLLLDQVLEINTIIWRYGILYQERQKASLLSDKIWYDYALWLINKNDISCLLSLAHSMIQSSLLKHQDDEKYPEIIEENSDISEVVTTLQFDKVDVWLEELFEHIPDFCDQLDQLQKTFSEIKNHLEKWEYDQVEWLLPVFPPSHKLNDIKKVILNQLQSLRLNNIHSDDKYRQLVWNNIETLKSSMLVGLPTVFLRDTLRWFSQENKDAFRNVIDTFKTLESLKVNRDIALKKFSSYQEYLTSKGLPKTAMDIFKATNFDIDSTEIIESLWKLLLDILKRQRIEDEYLKRKEDRKKQASWIKNKFLEMLDTVSLKFESLARAVPWVLVLILSFPLLLSSAILWKLGFKSIFKKLLQNKGFQNSLRSMESSILRNWSISYKWHSFNLRRSLESQTIQGFEIVWYENLDSRLLVWEVFYRFKNQDWVKERSDTPDIHTLHDNNLREPDHSFFLDEFNWEIDDDADAVITIDPGVMLAGENSIVVPRWYIPLISKDTLEHLHHEGIEYSLFCTKDTWYFYIDVSEKINFQFSLWFYRYWDKDVDGIFFGANSHRSECLLDSMIDTKDIPEGIKGILNQEESSDMRKIRDLCSYLWQNFLYSTEYEDTVKQYKAYSWYLEWISQIWIWDCKNVNSLNIALIREIWYGAQELAWYVQWDEWQYNWHAVSEVNLGWKSKIFDATPSRKKEKNTKKRDHTSPSWSIEAIQDLKESIKWKVSELEKFFLTLSTYFLEKKVKAYLTNLQEFFFFKEEETRNYPSLANYIATFPDISILRKKMSSKDYRSSLEEFFGSLTVIVNSISKRNEKEILDSMKDIESILSKHYAIRLLNTITKINVSLEDFYSLYIDFKSRNTSGYTNKSMIFCIILEKLWVDSELTSKLIEQLWYNWIYEVLVDESVTKISDVFYVTFDTPGVDILDEENNIHDYDSKKDHEELQSMIDGINDVSSLRPGDIFPLNTLKYMLSGLVQSHQMDWEYLPLQLFRERRNILIEFIDKVRNWKTLEECEYDVLSYMRENGVDNFIKLLKFYCQWSRNSIDYKMLLLDDIFLHDPENIIFLYQLVRNDISNIDTDSLRQSGFANFRWIREHNLELKELRWVRDNIFARLKDIWESNPHILFDLYHIQEKYTDNDKLLFIKALTNIDSLDKSDEEYVFQAWLNMLPDSWICNMYDNYIITILLSTISQRCIRKYLRSLEKSEWLFTQWSIRHHAQKIEMYFLDTFL